MMTTPAVGMRRSNGYAGAVVTEPPKKGREAVFVTWRVNARPVADHVVTPVDPGELRRARASAVSLLVVGGGLVALTMTRWPGSTLAWVSLALPAVGMLSLARTLGPSGAAAPLAGVPGVRREEGRLVVDGRDAPVPLGAEQVALQEGRVDVRARVVRTFGLPRWVAEQSDLVFPLVMLIVTVFGLQLHLLALLWMSIFPPPAAPAAPEPSIEYLTRLLRGDNAGEEEGLIAKRTVEVPSETKIESYYLPAGSPGPITEPGGGARVGPKPRAADPRPQKGEDASLHIEEFGETEGLTPDEAPPAPDIDDLADPLASPEGEQTDLPQSIEKREGFGLTDWYDTEDARREQTEVEQTIAAANQLLKLDPDNLYGLSVKSYYQYLAMDFEGAEATYDRMLVLDGTSGATWNNLALIYKRKGDWKKEEELYATSLLMEPDQPNTYINLALCYGHQGRFDEALQTMKRVEKDLPDDPYADLHRAKIHALMGQEEKSYHFLRKSLISMRKLDTLHNIEYQQDIRVDPAFEKMRETARFKSLLTKHYGHREGGWWLFKGKEGEE
jgi:Tfp pilus assembly protein PilF